MRRNYPFIRRDSLLLHTEGLGGGVNLITTFALIINSTISENENYNGGALWISSNSLKNLTNIAIIDTVLHNNTAHFDGGAILFAEDCENMKVNIDNCSFTKNYGAESGGAISTFFKSKEVLIFLNSCLIEENTSVIGGGVAL